MGLLIASLPVATVIGLVFVFGIYALTDGLTNVAHYFYDPSPHSRWSMAGGIVSIVAGLVAVAWPSITAVALGILVGVWALALGISQIVLALETRKSLRVWWSWLMTAVVTVLFGLLVIANPGAGIVALAGLLAAFAVIAGILLIASGITLRRAGSPTNIFRKTAMPG